MGRRKFDYVEKNTKSRSRSDLHLEMILVMHRQCDDVSLCEFFFTISLLVFKK